MQNYAQEELNWLNKTKNYKKKFILEFDLIFFEFSSYGIKNNYFQNTKESGFFSLFKVIYLHFSSTLEQGKHRENKVDRIVLLFYYITLHNIRL